MNNEMTPERRAKVICILAMEMKRKLFRQVLACAAAEHIDEIMSADQNVRHQCIDAVYETAKEFMK